MFIVQENNGSGGWDAFEPTEFELIDDAVECMRFAYEDYPDGEFRIIRFEVVL